MAVASFFVFVLERDLVFNLKRVNIIKICFAGHEYNNSSRAGVEAKETRTNLEKNFVAKFD